MFNINKSKKKYFLISFLVFLFLLITNRNFQDFIKNKIWYWQTGKELKQQCLKLEEEYKNREYIEYDLKRGDLDPHQMGEAVQQQLINLCWADYKNKDKPFYNYQDFIKSEFNE